MENERKIRVLAVDDHRSVLEVYAIIFNSIDKKYEVDFNDVNNCRSAYETITDNINNPFDLAVLDYNLPMWEEKQMYSGLEIAQYLRNTMPGCRIIFVTMQKEEKIYERIIREVNPEGLVHKIDCGLTELTEGFVQILEGKKFYSKSIEQANLPAIKPSIA